MSERTGISDLGTATCAAQADTKPSAKANIRHTQISVTAILTDHEGPSAAADAESVVDGPCVNAQMPSSFSPSYSTYRAGVVDVARP